LELRLCRRVLLENRAFHLAVENPVPCRPGSVFKAFTVLAALEEGVLAPGEIIPCRVGRRPYHGCHLHGPIDAVEALERSCNHFCYVLGRRLGERKLVSWLDRIAFFDPIPGLPQSLSGLRAYLLEPGQDPQNLAIGKGSLSCYPLQAAKLAACLATGRVVRPWLAKPPGFQALGPRFAREDHLALVREGLRLVVFKRGTAGRHTGALRALHFAGKTGTAQLSNRLDDGIFDSWFVGYVPWEAPRYAIAVLLDHTRKEGPEVGPLAAKVARAVGEVLGPWW